MERGKAHPERKSPRLQGYDYTQAGAYFVTICTFQREHLFGDIVSGQMKFDEIGKVVLDCWQDIPGHFSVVELDAFVVMPNHLHGIVIINSENSSDHTEGAGTRYISSLQDGKGRARGVKRNSLGAIIGTYKAAVTRQVNVIMGLTAPHIWQERYHDHIIRNAARLNQLRQYIENNPTQWESDVFYQKR